MKQKVAVIGAWSAMGRAIVDCLAARGFPAEDVYALDGCQKAGELLPYGAGGIETARLDVFDFGQIGISFLCTSAILAEDVDKIFGYGLYLIDCIGLICETPCVVFGVNMKNCRKQRLILNPTGLSIVLAHVFKPLHNDFHVKSASITALLSASEFGRETVEALVNQTRSLYTREAPKPGPFQKTQAFSLIPEIAPILVRQTTDQIKKMLQIPVQIAACLTPIFQGGCLSLLLTTKKKILCSEMEEVFPKKGICRIVREMSPCLTIGTADTLGSDGIYLMNIKSVSAQPNTYHMWIVYDNIQTSAALNAVRIAEYILS